MWLTFKLAKLALAHRALAALQHTCNKLYSSLSLNLIYCTFCICAMFVCVLHWNTVNTKVNCYHKRRWNSQSRSPEHKTFKSFTLILHIQPLSRSYLELTQFWRFSGPRSQAPVLQSAGKLLHCLLVAHSCHLGTRICPERGFCTVQLKEEQRRDHLL